MPARLSGPREYSYRSFSGRNKEHQLTFDWSVPGNSKLSGVMLGENQ